MQTLHTNKHRETQQTPRNKMYKLFPYSIRLAVAAFLTVATVSSCIDEDLSECGKDYRADYTVHLRTNVATEIETELTTNVEKQFGVDLQAVLGDVFTDWARDLDLSFYTDDERLAQHDLHQMDASQASYTIFLPVRRYENLALANVAQEPNVGIEGIDGRHAMRLEQVEGDTVTSQRIGLFSARQTMEIEDRDQEFHVNLYMQNCTACLVLDPGNVPIADVKGCVTGLASSFNVSDSIYSFQNSVPVRANQLRTSTGRLLIGLYATGFPSRDSMEEAEADAAGAAYRHAAPRESAAAEEKGIWYFKAYVRLANGKTTESVLAVKKPLRAGQLRIIKAVVKQDGSLASTSQDVGVSVKLDWKPGGNHDIEI